MLIMTEEQKYNAVIKELGEVLQNKNTTISCQKWKIEQLKEKLKSVEAERDAATAHAKELDMMLLDAKCEIERLKDGAA